jgi:hypothetical protein
MTTITTQVVDDVALPRESIGQGQPVSGTEIRLFADGRLVAVVEYVPNRSYHGIPHLVATPVSVRVDDFTYDMRAEFPNGGSHERTVDECAAIEAEHAASVTP